MNQNIIYNTEYSIDLDDKNRLWDYLIGRVSAVPAELKFLMR